MSSTTTAHKIRVREEEDDRTISIARAIPRSIREKLEYGRLLAGLFLQQALSNTVTYLWPQDNIDRLLIFWGIFIVTLAFYYISLFGTGAVFSWLISDSESSTTKTKTKTVTVLNDNESDYDHDDSDVYRDSETATDVPLSHIITPYHIMQVDTDSSTSNRRPVTSTVRPHSIVDTKQLYNDKI
jgi:hypothetical protein